MLSIILPIDNKETLRDELYQRISAASHIWLTDYEVICVNNTGDRSLDRHIDATTNNDARWKKLTLAYRVISQSTVLAGLEVVRGDVVAIMPTTFSVTPEDLHHFLYRWENGAKIIRAHHRLSPILEKLLKRPLVRANSFCLFDRKVVDTINQLPLIERCRLQGLPEFRIDSVSVQTLSIRQQIEQAIADYRQTNTYGQKWEILNEVNSADKSA